MTTHRDQLKSHFRTGAIPLEQHFSQLIEESINKADDGIRTGAGLGVRAEAETGNTLLLYRDFTAADGSPRPADWKIVLPPATEKGQPADFSLRDASDTVRLFIDRETGNVGIGTATPQRKLHVAGDIQLGTAGTLFWAEDGRISSRDESHQILFRSAENILELREAGSILFSPGRGTEGVNKQVVISPEGRVGIGTNDPRQALHVMGNVQLDSGQEVYFTSSGQIRSQDDRHRILFRTAENTMEFREAGRLVFSPGSNGEASTERVVMDETGRVGIGIAAPEFPLHVAGNARVTEELRSGTLAVDQNAHVGGAARVKGNIGLDGRLLFRAIEGEGTGLVSPEPTQVDLVAYSPPSGGTPANRRYAALRVESRSDQPAFQWQITPAYAKAPDTVMLIDPKGRVGIGTTEPQAELHIAGATRSDGDLNVGGTGKAQVIARHLEGKLSDGTEYDDLFLNWHSGKNVQVAKPDQKAQLIVHGQLGVDAADPQVRLAIGDNATGLDTGGADTLVIKTAAAERLRIDAEGNTGVGTSQPKELFHVGGNALIDNQLGSNTLHVAAEAAVDGDLTLSGRIELGDPEQPLHIGGPTVVEGSLTAEQLISKGNASVGGNLDTAGTGQFGGSLTSASLTTGDAAIEGDLTLTGLMQSSDPEQPLRLANDTNVAGLLTTEGLNVAGNAAIGGNLDTAGTGQFGGSLTSESLTTGDAAIEGDLTLTGLMQSSDPEQPLRLANDTDIAGQLTTEGLSVAGDAAIGGQLSTEGDANIGGALTSESLATGDADVGGDLTLTGLMQSSDPEQPLRLANDTDIAGELKTESLSVAGDTQLGGQLDTAGAGHFGAELTSQSLETGDAGLSGNLTLAGQIQPSDSEQPITLAGNTQVNGQVTTEILAVNQDAAIGGGLSTQGDGQIGGKLKSKALETGEAGLSGNLTMGGQIQSSDPKQPLRLAGATQIEGKLSSQSLAVEKNVSVNGKLSTKGDAKFGGTLVSKVVETVGLSVSGEVNLGGDVPANLRVAYLEGRATPDKNTPTLFLNYAEGKEVQIGQTKHRSRFEVFGNSQLDGTLKVSKATEIGGQLTVGTDPEITSLDVTGDARVSGTLTVGHLKVEELRSTENHAFTGELRAAQGLLVEGVLSTEADTPGQTLQVKGDALVSGNLIVGEPDRMEKIHELFAEEPSILFAPSYGTDDHAWIRFHSRSKQAHNLEIQVSKMGEDHLVLQPGGGNVGVGTITPMEKFQVEGDSAFNGYLMVGDPVRLEKVRPEFGDKPGILFAAEYGSDDHAWIRFHSRSNQAHNLEIQVSKMGEDHLVLQPEGGNVGIGTITPREKFHVEGTALFSGELQTEKGLVVSGFVGEETDNLSQALRVDGDALVSGHLIVGDPERLAKINPHFEDEPSILFAPSYGSDDHAWIRFHSRSNQAHNLEIQVSKMGEDHLVFQPDGGNVGVGTITPREKFHVEGNALFSGELRTENGMVVGGFVGDETDNLSQALQVDGDALVSGHLIVGDPERLEKINPHFEDQPSILFAPSYGSDDHAWIRFHSRSNQAHNLEIQVSKMGEDHLVLQPEGGNIGVGTITPLEKFQVEGNALVSGHLMVGDPERLQKVRPEFGDEPGVLFAAEYGSDDHAWIRFHSRSKQAHNLEIQVSIMGEDHLVLQPRGGLVGVGTEDPQEQLHVSDNFRLDGTPLVGHRDEKGQPLEGADPWFVHDTLDKVKAKDGHTTRIPVDKYHLILTTVQPVAGRGKAYSGVLENSSAWRVAPDTSGNYWQISPADPEHTGAKASDAFSLTVMAVHKQLCGTLSDLPEPPAPKTTKSRKKSSTKRKKS